jgi:hypothetical protein
MICDLNSRICGVLVENEAFRMSSEVFSLDHGLLFWGVQQEQVVGGVLVGA